MPPSNRQKKDGYRRYHYTTKEQAFLFRHSIKTKQQTFNKPNMNWKRILKWGAGIAAIAISAIIGITGYGYYLVKMQTIKLNETVYIYITHKDDAATVMQKIRNAASPESMKGFELLARHNNFDKRKRSGKFAIKDGDTMHSIYRRIVSNEQTPVKLVVPSTRTLPQLVGAISKQLMIDSLELSEFTEHPIYITRTGYTHETFPTLFIPNTYEVYWDIKPERLMIRFMDERRKFWNDKRLAKAKDLGMTPEEVATLASIVDEETNDNEEKPIVAGLYINRLKKGMPLQADPTVKFALGDPTRRRILNSDLEVESPYNTYRNTGLPPGPIRIATLQGLESVLNHKKHDYLYMCAKEDFSGTHNFARTLSEHNANARRYQQALNKRNITK